MDGCKTILALRCRAASSPLARDEEVPFIRWASMRLSRMSVITAGVAAFAPLLLFLAVPFTSGESFSNLAVTVVAATWLVCTAFVIYALRTSAVPVGKRGLWVAVIILGNIFALPPFWFWYVWRFQTGAPVSHT